MTTYVVLLRGINVGGHNRIKVADLKDVLTSAGLHKPVTLLQSGNIVVDSNASGEALSDIIETTIESSFGFHTTVILRIGDEFQSVVENHPFAAGQLEDPRMAHVMFLKSAPNRHGFDELCIAHEGPDEMMLAGSELFIYYPEGSGRSKLNAKAIEKFLDTTGTARNWNTVTKISEVLKLR